LGSSRIRCLTIGLVAIQGMPRILAEL
jgi:hypothetical protein